MRSPTLVALALLMVAFTTAATVVFKDIGAKSESGGVLVTWTTTTEEGVAEFIVQRKSQTDDSFYGISGPIKATGSEGMGNSYQYFDNAVFKTMSGTLFLYRICAEDENGVPIGYSSTATTPYGDSGLSGIAQKTWGSIKAMFR